MKRLLISLFFLFSLVSFVSGETAFTESFSNSTGTMGWTGSGIANGSLITDNSSWTISNGYGAGGSAKFGTGSKLGSAQTPSINCGSTITATLSFKAGAWNGSSESTTLKLSYTNCSGDKSTITLIKGSWTTYNVTLSNISGDIKITFEGNSSSNSRFLLDDIIITYSAATIDVTGIFITDTLLLTEGNSETLTPIITPENATNKNVTWGSINTDVATVSNGEVNAVSIGITKVWVKTEVGNKTDTCVVIVLPTPPEPSIEVMTWDTNAVYVNIENFNGLTATIEGHGGNNVADDLFFSKYFEADGDNKLIAIYNGTLEKKNLNNYQLIRSEWQNTSQSIRIHRTIELNGFGHTETGYIYPGEEIIILRYTNNDTSADTCSRKQENYDSWYIIGSGTLDSEGNNIYSWLSFAGPMSIGLYDKTKEKFIDIIGASTNSSGTGNLVQIKSSNSNPCNDAINSEYNDGAGFSTLYGDNFKTDEIETNYFLSTNRCLLIRKNTVHSGDSAVKYNVYSTDLDCNSTISNAFITLSTEWSGFQISNVKGDAAKKLTCEGLAYVGGFDYSKHYSTSIDLEDTYQSDGTNKIYIPGLSTHSCDSLKITIYDENDNKTSITTQIPIMISKDSTSTQILANKVECSTCDLVIMHRATLTVNNNLSNSNIKVYEGSRLFVESNKTYTINSLSLRKTDDANPYLTLNGNIQFPAGYDSCVYFDMYTDPSEWGWLALPDTFDIRNITLSNGKQVTHGVDYLIKTYNGRVRAINKKNGWLMVNNDKVFMPGEGFIFGIAGEGTIKKEFRFKFANTILNEDKQDKILKWDSLRAWGCDEAIYGELAPNHKGWNLVGNAFLDKLLTEVYEPIRIGKLVKSDTDPWDGKWDIEGGTIGKLRYRIIYERGSAGEDGNGYSSQLLDDVDLEPFETFFIQLGGTTENLCEINLHQSNRRKNAMRRVIETIDEDDELFLRVFVDNKKTGMFISNKFIKDYEPGDDLESRQTIYQLIGGYKLLYSAINDSIIENGIQIHSLGGKVTLDPKVETEKFEQIYILYNNEWYDLLYGDEPEVSGDFVLYGKRKINEDIPTDIGNIKPGQGTYKFLHENNIFINNKGKIYNVLGSSIQ